MPTAVARPKWFTWLGILLLGAQLTQLVLALRLSGSHRNTFVLSAVTGLALVGGLLAGWTHRRLSWALMGIGAACLLASILVRTAT